MDNLKFETLSAAALKLFSDNQREKSYLLIDVRQAWACERGHISGAMRMPPTEVEAGKAFLAIAQAEKSPRRTLARALTISAPYESV